MDFLRSIIHVLMDNNVTSPILHVMHMSLDCNLENMSFKFNIS